METGAKIEGFEPIEPAPVHLKGSESISSEDQMESPSLIKFIGAVLLFTTMIVAGYVIYCYCGRRIKKLRNKRAMEADSERLIVENPLNVSNVSDTAADEQ